MRWSTVVRRVRSPIDSTDSEIFPDTSRALSIHTPAGFDPAGSPPNLIVFNDGGVYADPSGQVRAPAVIDSMVDAGIRLEPDEAGETQPVFRRSVEYNTMDDT
jgi:hypothetical protein